MREEEKAPVECVRLLLHRYERQADQGQIILKCVGAKLSLLGVLEQHIKHPVLFYSFYIYVGERVVSN